MASKDKKTEQIDFEALLKSYRKHWWWFLISVFICGGMAYVYAKKHPAKYAVYAKVIIANDKTSSLTSLSGLGDLFGTSPEVEDEVYVVASHSLLRDVARELGLNKTHIVKTGMLTEKHAYPDFPIDVYPAPGIADTLHTGILFDVEMDKKGLADITVKANRKKLAELENASLPATIKTKYGLFIVDKTANCPKNKAVECKISLTGYDDAAESLEKEIKAEKASRKSHMIELSMISPNTAYATDVMNQVLELYNKRAIDEKNAQGKKTAKFIDERLALISGDLAEAEADIQQYKQKNAVADIQAEASYNMSRRGAAEQALTKAMTASEVIKMTRDFISNPDNAYELIPGAGSVGGAKSAIETYNSLILNRMNLLKTATPNNRVVKELDERIDAMREAINTALDREYKTSLVAIRDARAEEAKAMGGLSQVPEQEREFIGLKRQQMVKQELYLFLLERREETQMAISNAIPKGRIVDYAYSLSRPVSLPKIVILGLACILGLLIPALILYVMQMLKMHFENQTEFKKLSKIPVLGEISLDKTGRGLVVYPGETTSVAELFRAVYQRLLFVMGGKDHSVVLVTSTRSGEGKSFVAANLAATFALQGKKTLLIGMDIRKPRLAEYLGLRANPGVTNFLSNQSFDINSAVQPIAQVPNMSVLVAGPVPPNPAELLGSKAVEEMMEKLKAEFDIIIIDSAPVGMVADSFNLTRVADVSVYVTRANYTRKPDVRFANELYDEKRLPSMTAVINGTRATQGYGYGYGNNSDNKKH